MPSTLESDVGVKAGVLTEHFDARDPVFRERPHDVLDVLRAREPVHLDRKLDRVLLTRAADVAATLADRSLSMDPSKARPTTLARQSLTGSARHQRSMGFLDDPDHSRVRGLVAKAFTPGAIEALKPRIEAIAASLLDDIDPTRSFDLLAAYASPLPILIIAAMLGVDETQIAQFKTWSNNIVLLFHPDRDAGEQQRLDATLEALEDFFQHEIGERRGGRAMTSSVRWRRSRPTATGSLTWKSAITAGYCLWPAISPQPD